MFQTRRLLLTLLMIVGTTQLGGCAVNPVTGKNELSLIPESQELAIGAEQYLPSQQSQGGLYTVDPTVTRYVSEVGQRLARVSDRNLPYEFVVLNNSVPNAWALPGGKIAVNRGLLLRLESEAELAAVLGHEIVHAAAKHGANAMNRGMLLQLGVLGTALAAGDSEYANFIVGGAQLGTQLISTKYGREAELESDYYGMQYMKRAGYNPEAAIRLQETFVKLSGGNEPGWLDGLFASHPPSQERVNRNRETALALGMAGEVGRDRYRTSIATLIDSRDAYEVFDQAQAKAGAGDLPGAIAAVSRAIELESREPRFYGLRGDILLAQNKYGPATAEFEKALERDPNYYEYYLGRGLANARLGRPVEARADFERSNQLLPTAIAANALGELTLAAGERSTAKQYFQAAMAAQGPVGQNATNAFVRLDLTDNPGRYIEARPVLTDNRQLVAVIANRTSLTINNIQVEFQVTSNGNRIRRVVSIPSLAPGQGGNLASGWEFGGADTLENPGVSVLSAQLP
ncbi:MAG: M48 family metalloprotease [Pseudomonadota bacterium]